MLRCVLVFLFVAAFGAATAQTGFVNFETPHVHPLELTPDGTLLLAVNTADGRLEVFGVSGPALVPLGTVPVGVDPVTVRARDNGEAWVVNHVSDSISRIDLATLTVIDTLQTADEPADVVFAGNPLRAFVSCSQVNQVQVFDLADLAAAPTVVPIDAEDPRALAVSPDGNTVYAAIFESGNATTSLGGGSTMAGGFPPNVVDLGSTPHGGANPPPNDGGSFDPPQNGANTTPPRVSMIVRKDDQGAWRDDTGADWTPWVSGNQADQSGRVQGWDMPDRDVAVIDADTLAVSYVTRLMNIAMALAVDPTNGHLALVGTDATNEIRFEPVLTGKFLRVNLALVDPAGPTASVVDMNDHLDYTSSSVSQALRDRSIGDPRGVAFNATGTRIYVTGMGSNNLLVLDTSGARVGIAPTIEVGEGPTGIVLQGGTQRAYVLNKFEAAISVVDLITESETQRVGFHDASPTAIREGRRHLYSTHTHSGLGHLNCGSCHVDGRMDRLGWDLGDPSGDMKQLDDLNLGANIGALAAGFEDFHPMKGPMTTQTLQDIIGKEPLHWRGDRLGLEEFGPAFVGLQGADAQLSTGEMQEFEDFLATLHFPPNPYRNFDNSLSTTVDLSGHFTTGEFGPGDQPLGTGNAVAGLARYRPPNLLDANALACVTCHTMPTGLGPDMEAIGFTFTQIPPGPEGGRHHALVSQDGATNVSLKIPQLRNLYDKTGFLLTQPQSNAGFGFVRDGSVDTIARFINEPVFSLVSDQDTADMTAFMLSFSGSDLPQGSTNLLNLEPPGSASQDAHAAVGRQTTLVDLGGAPAAQLQLLSDMLGMADAGSIALVAKGVQGGLARGYEYLGSGQWQSDRQAESLTTAALQNGAASGGELTFTVVPAGTQRRVGVDRDKDGFFDRDELDAGSDPADGASTPDGPWLDQGSALAGLYGAPQLSGSGTLQGNTPISLSLTNARENTTAWIVVGFSELNLPFKGGTLVPSLDAPGFFLPLPTGPLGVLEVGGTWPAGVPADFETWYQYWISDASGPVGFSASNALKSITP